MAVMVTGGLGVIGSLVVRNLVDRGERPVVYEARSDDVARVRDVLDRIDIVPGDIASLPSLLYAIRRFNVDRLIHTAASIDPGDRADPLQTINVNVNGTINVLEAARIFGLKRVVYCSTRGVYDEIVGEHGYPNYVPITEDYPKMSPPSRHSLYDATKQFCEHLLVKYSEKYGVDFVALRFASTYSPGKLARHGPLSIVSQIIENAMRGAPTVIPKGGDEKDDFVYNKDVANALVLACYAQGMEHRFFHIGTGTVSSLRDVAEAVRKFYPDARIEIGPGLDFRGIGIKYYACFDTTRARRELGYEPQYPLEKGVGDYIRMVKELGLLETG